MNLHVSFPRDIRPRRVSAFRTVVVAAVLVAGVTAARAAELPLPPPPGIPVLRIDTDGAAPIVSRRQYARGSVSLAANGGVDSTGRPMAGLATTPIRVRGRGNTSWEHPKKPWRLKFDNATDILGMGAAKTWVLLANYVDPSGLRNATAFELGRRLGMPFTPEARHVNLVLNGEFQGLYLLTEQTEVAPHRVVTDTVDGFLVEFDDYPDPDEEIFSTQILDLPLKIKRPDLAELPPTARAEAVARITGIFNAFERTITAADGPGDYAAILDVDSIIDWFLVHEITHNYEPRHPKSCFFHLAVDGRIAAGPLWDFDWSFDHEDLEPNVLLLKNVAWFPHLFKDPGFTAKVKARWTAIRDGPAASLPAYVDGLVAAIGDSVEHDMRLWPGDDDYRLTPEGPGLAAWLKQRIALLDEAIEKL